MKTCRAIVPSAPSDVLQASSTTPVERCSDGETGDQIDCISVSIVSNSRILREGLVSLLREYVDLRLVTAYVGETPPTTALANPVGHLVLLDGGIDLDAAVAWTRYWRDQIPPAQVMVLELTQDIDVIMACIEAGAGGYTCRNASAAQVAEVIRQMRRGEAQCAPEVTARLFARLEGLTSGRARPSANLPPLTARELEVLRYIARNYNNQEIAAALVIEVCTVKHHVHNILDKLRVHHRRDAARFAAEQGWLAEPSPKR